MTQTSSVKTPIALFVYNRPVHTSMVLATLARCTRLDECVLRVYCDGPKDGLDAQNTSAVRKVVHGWIERLGGEVIERETNLGLARSIVSGVSESCDRYGRVIVLEDDFGLNPSFLNYMLQALDRYAKEARVYQISGYMHPVRHRPRPDAFFLPLMTTWGWATWARAWRIFDWTAPGARELLQDSEQRLLFDLNGVYPYSDMLEARLRGENDSWGILFWFSIFKANGLVLHPRQSFVWNGGFDNSGTHCGDRVWSNHRFTNIVSERISNRHWIFPDEIKTDEVAFRKITNFLKAELSAGNLVERVRRRMLQRIRAKELRRIHDRYSSQIT